MACVVERVRYALGNLLDSGTGSWTPEFEQGIATIFDNEAVENMFTCSCLQPRNGQGGVFSYDSVQRRRRVFATCIIAGKPILIRSFLSSKVDDTKFEALKLEDSLVNETQIDKSDARILLGIKHLFFGINLAMYLRTTRHGDPPDSDERNWLMDEVLEAMRRLAYTSPTDPRAIKYAATPVGDLVIRKNEAMAKDRRATSRGNIRQDPITTQSLGFLVLDLIWFILGGGRYVVWLDENRSEGVNWVKRLPTGSLEKDPQLLSAFEMVWILIQPPQESLTLIREDDFLYVYEHFSRIWPSQEIDTIIATGSNASKDESTSSLGLGPFRCEFREIGTSQGFRWIILQFSKDDNMKGCRIRIFKSTDRVKSELRFDIYSFRNHPVKPKYRYVDIRNARFVPLYAYAGTSGYKMMIQSTTGSARQTGMPYVFKFRTLQEVQLFQTVLTRRRILKDIAIRSFSLEPRRPTIRLLHPKEENLNWINGQLQRSNPTFGRIQIWEVMNDDELEEANEYERDGTRASRDYNLRFQIAIFSDSMLIILGVKSLLKLVHLDFSGLLLESKEGTRNTCFEGRRFKTQSVGDETIYPGLQLFQSHPFEPSPDGDGVKFNSLSFYFIDESARDELRGFIDDTQRLLN